MTALEWLNAELEQAKAAYAERPAGVSGYSTYWTGYMDAITNVLNELAGPGDTN